LPFPKQCLLDTLARIVDQHRPIGAFEYEQAARCSADGTEADDQLLDVAERPGSAEAGYRASNLPTDQFDEIEVVALHATIVVYGIQGDLAHSLFL